MVQGLAAPALTLVNTKTPVAQPVVEQGRDGAGISFGECILSMTVVGAATAVLLLWHVGAVGADLIVRGGHPPPCTSALVPRSAR
jgi:hypothetical protein